MDTATFAGGCFWCMEPPFRKLRGVTDVVTGYSGGDVEDPEYEDVCSGETGHFEAVQVTFDPRVISYEQLLDVYWQQIDPTDPNGQFADKGPQYRTAIFHHDEKQRQAAEESSKRIDESGKFTAPIAVQILPFENFYPAEEHHQSYHEKNPARYRMYRDGSGRAAYLERTCEK